MKTCPTCHQAIPDDALFCPIDGTSLASAESDPLLGTVIADRYVLLERVGQGNTGTIYRGEHVVLRQKIAVKLLHHKLSKDEAAVDRFRQEAAALAQIDSEHIVRVSDFGMAEDGRIFFAMEFLEGETLAAALGREGKFPEARAVAVLGQIGDALGDAHRLGYVHRDIRPRNVFLCERKGEKDFVKLLDFGLAKLMEVPKGAKTALGTTLGDPRYMSPEQARGDQVDQRSDIYSLAIIGYQMVTGSPPFVGAGTFDVLTKHLEAQPVPIAEKVSGISKRYAEAVAKALGKKPQDRYPTVERFLGALAGTSPVEVSLEEKAAALKITPASAPPAGDADITAPFPKQEPTTSTKTLMGTGAQVKEVMAAIEEAEQEKRDKAKQAMVGAVKAQEPAPAKALAITPASSGLLEKQTLTNKAPAKAPAKPAATAPSASPFAIAPRPPATPAAPPAPAAPQSPPAAKPAAAAKPAVAQPPAAAPAKPATTTPAAAAAAPAAVKREGSQPLAKREGSQPGGLARTASSPGFDPEMESYDAASQSGNWFAEGLAAEKELATTTKSGPLPAIYDALDEEEPLKRNIPPAAIIAVVVVAVGIFLVLFLFVFGKKEETPEKPKVAVATKVNPATENPVPKVEPVPEPKVDPVPEPKVDPVPEPKVEPKVEPPKAEPPKPKPEPPKPKAEPPKPKPKPKAEPRHRPKPKPKPKAEPRRRKPKPDRRKPEPQPKMGLGRDPLSAATHVKEGRVQLQRGSYTKARAEFNKALEADPRNAGAHAGLGEVAFELGNYALAAKHLRTAVLLAGRSSRYKVMLGNAYFKMGRTKQAVEQYRAALKVDPNNAAARTGLEAAVRRLAGGG